MAGYPALPKGIALSMPRNPLLEKETFDQLQRNDIIETRPHVLHFGGFQIHKVHTQVLRIVNISPSSLRVSIIGPVTQWFKITFDKKGLLAPGMSEDISVTFEPHEWRYYYDSIKIFCGDQAENLIVPIHGYPSANDIVLPRIIDFGTVAIGTSRTKVIPLSCKVPIQFEFEVQVLEDHPDFVITPLRGVIPSDGAIDVVVTFLPTKHRTARVELQFNIAQFDFEPVTVTVVGSCLPDLLKQEVLQSSAAEKAVVAAKRNQDDMAAAAKRLKEKKSRKPLEAIRPTFAQEETERYIQGIKVPVRMNQQATNFILNQTAGKLPLKDLFAFIKEQREAADSRHRWAATRAEGSDDPDEVSEDEDKQAVELRFELHYREVDKLDKDKELKSMRATGEAPPTEENAVKVIEGRERRHDRLLEHRMRSDAQRAEPVVSNRKVTVPCAFHNVMSPSWDENTNDTFSVRLQVIERFVRVGSKVLMRVRAKKRAEKLREALKAANVTDRASCRAWVEMETKAAITGSGQGKKTGAAKAVTAQEDPAKLELVRISKDFVLPFQMPVSVPGLSAEERVPIEVTPLDNFEEFLTLELNVRMDFKVLAYDKHVVPPSAAYMRPNSHRTRLQGALEEHLMRGPCGGALDGAEVPLAMPDSCLLGPAHDALSLLIPSTDCRTFVGFPEATECDPEYRLARMPPFIGPMLTEPLIPQGIMSLESPWLKTWRRSRQIADPFQYFDPFPASFAEAGGNSGPRLGSDIGGQSLAFAPVGGLDRDLPSDTDDDEQAELAITAPGQDAFKLACASLEGPLQSELWQKQQMAEAHLAMLCKTQGRSVRDRLNDLNRDLSFANKIYLG